MSYLIVYQNLTAVLSLDFYHFIVARDTVIDLVIDTVCACVCVGVRSA